LFTWPEIILLVLKLVNNLMSEAHDAKIIPGWDGCGDRQGLRIYSDKDRRDEDPEGPNQCAHF